jgi:lipoate-protein ligase A
VARTEDAGTGRSGEFWRLLPLDVGASRWHFALSDALARLAEMPTVWWHATNAPTLILGAGQRERDVDVDACRAAGVTVVQRQAGGTAVFAAAGVLGLDVALPPGHQLIDPDVVEAYRWLGETWSQALRALGVTGRVVSVEEARSAQTRTTGTAAGLRLACFGSLSPYEVAVGSRKLVGLSQVRRRGRELLQSAVHLHFDADALAALLSVPDRARLANELRGAAMGLDEATDLRCTVEDVVSAVHGALADGQRLRFVPGDWTEQELAHARVQAPEGQSAPEP